jgi:putative ABC transport system ATP-binding protein
MTIGVGGSSFEAELAKLRSDRIGFIFQTFNLLPVLTAQENVEYPLIRRNLPAKERRAMAEEALKKVGRNAKSV